jgi:hypothetical protein
MAAATVAQVECPRRHAGVSCDVRWLLSLGTPRTRRDDHRVVTHGIDAVEGGRRPAAHALIFGSAARETVMRCAMGIRGYALAG